MSDDEKRARLNLSDPARMKRATTLIRDAFDEGDEPCPMGCGNLTDDPYGGPCEQCWSDV